MNLDRCRTFRRDEDGELEKRCGRCHEWLPADLEFFGSQPDETLGLSSHCRVCITERFAAKRRAQGIPARHFEVACKNLSQAEEQLTRRLL